MRIGLFQGPQVSSDVHANLDRIQAAAEQAASRGADLLLTAELALTGYNIGALSAERAEPVEGNLGSAISTIARGHGIAIAYGYVERTDAGIFNSVAVRDRAGNLLANYRKSHLYGDLDRGLFSPGQDLVVQFDFAGARCGIAICYDIEFPEVARAHAEAGTDVLLVPTGLMAPFEVVSRILVPARAYENQLFVAYANRCDTEAELHYCGLSVIVGPDGEDIARAGATEELLLADLDQNVLAESRLINTHLRDRRADLYRSHAKGTLP